MSNSLHTTTDYTLLATPPAEKLAEKPIPTYKQQQGKQQRQHQQEPSSTPRKRENLHPSAML